MLLTELIIYLFKFLCLLTCKKNEIQNDYRVIETPEGMFRLR